MTITIVLLIVTNNDSGAGSLILRTDEIFQLQMYLLKQGGIPFVRGSVTESASLRKSQDMEKIIIGSKKLQLQALFTAAAFNVLRACEWIAEPTTQTPISCFARFVAALPQARLA